MKSESNLSKKHGDLVLCPTPKNFEPTQIRAMKGKKFKLYWSVCLLRISTFVTNGQTDRFRKTSE